MLIDLTKHTMISLFCISLLCTEAAAKDVYQPLFPNIASCDRTTFGILSDGSTIFALERYTTKHYKLFHAKKTDEQDFTRPTLISPNNFGARQASAQGADNLPLSRNGVRKDEPVLSNKGELLIPTGRHSLDVFSFETNSLEKVKPFLGQGLRTIITSNKFDKWLYATGNVVAARLFPDREYHVSNVYSGYKRIIPVADPNVVRVIFDGNGNPEFRMLSTPARNYRFEHYQDQIWIEIGRIPSTNFVPVNYPDPSQDRFVFQALVYSYDGYFLYDFDIKKHEIRQVSDPTKQLKLVQSDLNEEIAYVVYEEYLSGARSIEYVGENAQTFPFTELTEAQMMDGVIILDSDHAIYKEGGHWVLIEKGGKVYPICGRSTFQDELK